MLTLHTTLGDLKLELAHRLAPRLCENFLALAASGSYDGTRFHRVVAGFIVQGGDPTGTGKGGAVGVAGLPLADEFSQLLRHDARGVLSAANSGVADSNGAQFFVCFAAAPSLDDSCCVIGRAVGAESFATLDRLEAVPINKRHRPLEDVVITSATIHANPLAPT